MIPTAIIIVMWLALGFVGAGWFYAYLQRAYPLLAEKNRRADTALTLISILFGFATFMAAMECEHHKHGWLFPGSKP